MLQGEKRSQANPRSHRYHGVSPACEIGLLIEFRTGVSNDISVAPHRRPVRLVEFIPPLRVTAGEPDGCHADHSSRVASPIPAIHGSFADVSAEVRHGVRIAFDSHLTASSPLPKTRSCGQSVAPCYSRTASPSAGRSVCGL